MQCGKHQVAGQRRLNAGRDRFFIAHLANHDDVGIGAQKCLHHNGKFQSCFFVNLDLTQTLLGNFNRIFGSPYFCVRFVQIAQHRMQRGCFTRAGRPANKEQAIGLLYSPYA